MSENFLAHLCPSEKKRIMGDWHGSFSKQTKNKQFLEQTLKKNCFFTEQTIFSQKFLKKTIVFFYWANNFTAGLFSEKTMKIDGK